LDLNEELGDIEDAEEEEEEAAAEDAENKTTETGKKYPKPRYSYNA
jgi:hypothetical protein